jgi:methionyl-tRNA formyltransferase
MTVATSLNRVFGPVEDIILLGGGKLLRTLSLWAKSKDIPLKVVTSPRHAKESLDHVRLDDFLNNEGINYLVVQSISEDAVKPFIGSSDNTFFLSLGAAWIFKPPIISDYFHDRLFNLHGTRLPQNRGGGGFSWQVLTGNRFGFCLLHLIEGGVDTGDIVCVDEFLYPSTCRKPVDYEKVSREKNLQFVVEFIEKFQKDGLLLDRMKQSEYFSSYWPRLNSDINGWIDWSLEASEIDRFICAFDDPYAGAQTYLNDRVVRLKGSAINRQDGVFHSFQSGLIYRKGKHWLCVCVKDCAVIVEEIYDEHGKNIFDEVSVGDRFITPIDKLVSSKTRPIYTSTGLKEVSIAP